jgi:exonuclease VII small subunit
VNVERGFGDASVTGRNSLAAARLEFHAQAERFEAARARLQETLDQIQDGRYRQEAVRGASPSARLEFHAQAERFEAARARLQETLDQIQNGRPRKEILRSSAFARLRARLDTLPVIEQAKGILMAQERCGPDEAFDLLRRASQRSNIKVSELAAQIVEQAASHTTL